MKPFKSLNFTLVLIVFSLMVFSGVLAALILLILARFNIISQIGSTAILFFIVGLIVSTIIGTLLAFPVGNYLLKPLNDLMEGTREVAKGNFDIRTRLPKRNFGIRDLINSFNIMTKELGSIEMLRKDFISNVSHEFNTPLASIQGFAKLLQKGNLSQEKKDEYTNIIIEETVGLSNLSSNILRLSKIEHQGIMESRSFFSLDEQIRKSILLLDRIWGEKDIEFNLHLDKITYTGDEELLQHAWVNLISNAIKFSHKGGIIDIELKKRNDKIQFRIADYGIGMSEETTYRVFEEFYQADKSRSQEGNGLGLPLVKQILKIHGGDIHVESKLSQGSTFIVLLPINKNLN